MPQNKVNLEEIDRAELVQLAALDGPLFSRAFFPKTVRQVTPHFHRELWDEFEDPAHRYLVGEVFRGGAKTTILRLYAAKRIAYGVSRVILYVGKSQDHARRSLRWLRKQIEVNKFFAQTFGLVPGNTWNDDELEVINNVTGESCWVLALGVTGSVRGVNFDDYRPDLIICDDLVTDDNAATQEQRDKLRKLVLGALKESMTPRTENALAKLVLLQTPIDSDDVSQSCARDPQFRHIRFGCWTPQTENLDPRERKSSWEERFPTDELLKEREAAIWRNELATFSKEMECKLIVSENAKFRAEWLKYYGEIFDEVTEVPPRHEMTVVMSVDPVPPPSEREIKKGYADKDYEAFAVVGKWRKKFIVLETSKNRGHEPNWTVTEFFRLAQAWQPDKILVESVAYQRTLVWLLRQAMQKLGRYWVVVPFTDRRSKMDRIVQGLQGPLSNGQFYLQRTQTGLISDIIHYTNVKHDDELEAVAVATTDLNTGFSNGEQHSGLEDETEYETIEYQRGAP